MSAMALGIETKPRRAQKCNRGKKGTAKDHAGEPSKGKPKKGKPQKGKPKAASKAAKPTKGKSSKDKAEQVKADAAKTKNKAKPTSSPKNAPVAAKTAGGRKALKMDAKNIHSRAYHKLYSQLKSIGFNLAKARKRSGVAGRKAVADWYASSEFIAQAGA